MIYINTSEKRKKINKLSQKKCKKKPLNEILNSDIPKVHEVCDLCTDRFFCRGLCTDLNDYLVVHPELLKS